MDAAPSGSRAKLSATSTLVEQSKEVTGGELGVHRQNLDTCACRRHAAARMWSR